MFWDKPTDRLTDNPLGQEAGWAGGVSLWRIRIWFDVSDREDGWVSQSGEAVSDRSGSNDHQAYRSTAKMIDSGVGNATTCIGSSTLPTLPNCN